MKTGSKLKLLYQYLSQKVDFASLVTLQKYHTGQIAPYDVWATALKNIFATQMIYFYRIKGLEMEPTISPKDTLVVRKLPFLSEGLKHHLQVINVGDVVVLKDPMDSNNHVIRRLAAVEGFEMVSNKEDDEPFVIEHGQGWVLSDNNTLTPKESNDSRTYGPISMSDILGRVSYRFRGLGDHGLVVNNKESMNHDIPVIYIELDSSELQRLTKNEEHTKSTSKN